VAGTRDDSALEARVDQAVFSLEKAHSANPEQGPQPHAWRASASALEGESKRPPPNSPKPGGRAATIVTQVFLA
jgi:hypothetical protein